MFYRDHNPPHFHAEYQGQNATFDFDGTLLEGEIDSRTAKDLIKKWARRHKPELNQN
jgi:ribonucleotide monophosphatase NagD (HAD superfamily)